VAKLPFRSLALVLVAASAVPLLVFTAVVVVRLVHDERAASQRRLLEYAETQSLVVERELTASIRTLTALAESERLDHGDIAGFHSDARRVVARQPAWESIVLLAPDGTQITNSARPEDAAVTGAVDRDSLRPVVRTRAPVVGTLDTTGEGLLVFPIRVPVIRAGRVEYVLTATITPETLSRAIGHQLPEEPWTRTLIAPNGVVMADTRPGASMVRQLAPPDVLQQTRRLREGIFRDRSLAGEPAYIAFSRGPTYGWTSIVAMRAASLDGPVRLTVAALAAFSVVALSLTALGAFMFAGRVARDLRATANAASAVSRGEHPDVPDSIVLEVGQVGAAIERSAALLAERERERDEHLARAEEARAAAEAADRAKDEFLAMLGHELRNPLSPIVTAAELLRARFDPPPREVEVIGRQTRQLTRLVDDLLDASRITRGKITLSRETLALRAVVDQAVEMTAPLYHDAGHRLTVEVADGCTVNGDRARLAQVIANLLVNAARYTPPHGEVRVEVRRDGDTVIVAVSDTGQGMTPELLPRVFDLFVQGPRTSDRQGGGLGIGLTLVQQLVRLHGGTVTAASEGAGRGSTFAVHLPAAAPATGGGEKQTMPAPAPASSPERLLVVDDNRDAADLLASLLEAQGHQVAVAYDAATALRSAKTLRPTVAFLDVGLPQMDGYELARRLRRALAPHVPTFVAVTGYGRSRDHARSASEGFAAHLVKPVAAENLAAVLAHRDHTIST